MALILRRSFASHHRSYHGPFVSVILDVRIFLKFVHTAFESGGLTISCTVLFPEQFDALRRTYDCEKSLIESLARCVKWDASGGKSGSAFLKTLGASLCPSDGLIMTYIHIDDRFIAKELSRAELQAMETFAPAYFDYMSSAVVGHVSPVACNPSGS